MDCSQAIRARRSIRKFKPDMPVPQEDLEKMLEAAMMAPSACNTRPWEFFVAEGEAKERLRQAHPYSQMLKTAPLAIVACGRPDLQEGRCEPFWPEDCGAAIQNLLLQAAELGFGTCWCGCYPNELVMTRVQKVLDTAAVPVALIAVGVPDEDPPARGFYEPAKVTFLR